LRCAGGSTSEGELRLEHAATQPVGTLGGIGSQSCIVPFCDEELVDGLVTLPEKEALLHQLTSQREHILGAIEGLDDAALRLSVLPSGWACVGLVSHLAIDVERFWFRAVTAGDEDIIRQVTEEQDDAWHVSPEIAAEAVTNAYRQEIELSNAIITSTPLEATPAWWPDFFGNWRLGTFREILLHVLTETAVHAGHLDAARELIDGRTWLVLT